ncbi:MAG: head GIN domain-containing protein [Gammaproteobacteria bacterium]
MHACKRFLSTTVTACTLAACTLAQADTERRALSDFTAIDVQHGLNVDIRIGDEFLVEVDSGDEDLADIETDVRNGTLHLGVDRDDWNWGDWRHDYRVSIVMPTLEEIETSGGADVRVSGTVTGDEFELDVSGGSDVEVEVAVSRIEIEASGGSDVDVSGTADTAIARTSGGSDVDARDLEARHAELRASGGSDLAMSVSETLEARASGAADIDYYGDPEVLDEDESGSSDIRRH